METSSPDDPGLKPSSRERLAATKKELWGLLCWRPCLLPTWRGWVVFGLGLLLFLVVVVRSLHPFLAINNPIPDGLLVVEGWMPDYGLTSVVEEFKRNHYDKVYVTGGPLEYAMYLTPFKTYAHLGAATLVKLGLDSNVVQVVPAPKVRQDRTYTAAVALRNWLLEHHITPTRIHLISEGPHTRRSRLLYEMAMGKGVVVGVTSVSCNDYDQQHWWRYSSGVRNVIGEGLAYLYARFLFFPPAEPKIVPTPP